MYKLNVIKKSGWVSLSIVIIISGLLSGNCKKKDLPEVTTAFVKYGVDEVDKVFYSTEGNVTYDGGKTVTSRGVCWSTNQSPTILDSRTSDGTGTGAFKSIISSYVYQSAIGLHYQLDPLTTYYVRAYATNDIGTAYGDQLSFTTPCVLNTNRLNVLWLISPINGAIGQSLNTTLSWGYPLIGPWPCDVYFGTSSNQLIMIATDITPLSHLHLNGLITGTTYYWRVIAKDKNLPCNNDTSAIYHFTTTVAR